MNYEQLKNQPDNILFYEIDLPAPALFQKVETVGDDIIVRAFDSEFEQSRFGFREMDSVTRDSKDFYVFSKDELGQLNEYLTLAYLTI